MIIKLFMFLYLSIFFTHSYAEIASNLFQNTSNSNFNKKKLINKIVAIANNEPITLSELEQEVKRLQSSQEVNSNNSKLAIRRLALEDLISQSILIQSAKQNNITISDQRLNAALKVIALKNGISVESLKLNIETEGMSFNEYKKRIKKELMISQLQQQAISHQINISPKEIQKYIEKHKKEFDKQISPIKTYILRNLIVALPTSKKDQKLKIQQLEKFAIAVNKGSLIFSDIAKKFSEAPNAEAGGIINNNNSLKFNSIPDIYKPKVKQLKQGQTSKPFIINNTMQMIYIDKIHKEQGILNKEIIKYYVNAIVIKLNNNMTNTGAENFLNRAILAIKNGESFAKVADKFNQNYDHADGDFGWVSPLDTPPLLPPTAFVKLQKLKKDQLSEAFQADAKTWMIIKYTKTKQFDATKELIQREALKGIFAEKAQQIYKIWLTSIKDDAYIEILENDLKNSNSILI